MDRLCHLNFDVDLRLETCPWFPDSRDASFDKECLLIRMWVVYKF
jgi:hypothetical protein